ncbi:ABC-three component system middle component 5 [Photobacterium damselae]|uniref:ABC-three component system middle component 5 n=1 Tax=Photobacterium damselae TaxID=38293 RepID=UPI004068E615
MIIYHPYKDANHCAYRILSILSVCKIPVNINYLHIADFYHLFPGQLKYIDKWPRKNTDIYNKLQNIPDSYECVDNPRKIFFELKIIRTNVLINLLSKNLIEYTDDNLIKIKYHNLPDSLVEQIKCDKFRESVAFQIITTKMKDLKLYGESGLKSKSGLMEYRYDL